MTLHGEAVDRDAVGLHLLDQLVVGVALRVDALHAVVVEEELGVGVGAVRPSERVGDDAGAELADPDVLLAVGAVVVEDLVGDVPLLDVTGVAADHGLDVVAQDPAQLRGIEVAVLQPRRVLVVPEQGVTAHHLPVLLGEPDDVVGRSEPVGVLCRPQELPLHLVLRRQGAELLAEDPPVGAVVRERVGVVLLLVVAAAGDGAAHDEVAGGGAAERLSGGPGCRRRRRTGRGRRGRDRGGGGQGDGEGRHGDDGGTDCVSNGAVHGSSRE